MSSSMPGLFCSLVICSGNNPQVTAQSTESLDLKHKIRYSTGLNRYPWRCLSNPNVAQQHGSFFVTFSSVAGQQDKWKFTFSLNHG